MAFDSKKRDLIEAALMAKYNRQNKRLSKILKNGWHTAVANVMVATGMSVEEAIKYVDNK